MYGAAALLGTALVAVPTMAKVRPWAITEDEYSSTSTIYPMATE